MVRLDPKQLKEVQERIQARSSVRKHVCISSEPLPNAPQSPIRKTPRVAERDVLKAVLEALKTHPKVAWVERMSVGGATSKNGSWIKLGFVGCPDILGQMKDGKLLGIEVKSTDGQPTAEQNHFIAKVTMHGGKAGIARSVTDALLIVES